LRITEAMEMMKLELAAIFVFVCTLPAFSFCDGSCGKGEEITGNAICWYNGTCCSEGRCWTNGTCYRDGACCWGNGTCCKAGKCSKEAICYMSNRLCCAQGFCWENATCYQNETCCAGGYCWGGAQAKRTQLSRASSLELLQEFNRTRVRIDISDWHRPRGSGQDRRDDGLDSGDPNGPVEDSDS